jgi:hypothetical protein
MSATDIVLRAKRGLHRVSQYQFLYAPKGKKQEREQRLRDETHELLRLEIKTGSAA